MDYTYYVFAFFVFILVCLAIWFSSRVGRKRKNEKDEYAKEQRLFKLYQNVEDMMNGFEEYVEEAKAELDEKIEIALKELKEDKRPKNAELIEMPEIVEPQQKVQEHMSLTKNKKQSGRTEQKNDKTDDLIADLMDKGLEIDDIAKKLGMSRRELSLIMKMKNGANNS